MKQIKIKIEEAKKKDLNSIIKLNKGLADFHRKIDKYYQSGQEKQNVSRRYLLRNLKSKNSKVLIMRDKKKIIGFFIGRIERSKPYAVPKKIGKVATAFISEKYQGKGIGKEVFKELINWFKANKIKYVRLSVDSRNKIGLAA